MRVFYRALLRCDSRSANEQYVSSDISEKHDHFINIAINSHGRKEGVGIGKDITRLALK